jgi:hypothetical protein
VGLGHSGLFRRAVCKLFWVSFGLRSTGQSSASYSLIVCSADAIDKVIGLKSACVCTEEGSGWLAIYTFLQDDSLPGLTVVVLWVSHHYSDTGDSHVMTDHDFGLIPAHPIFPTYKASLVHFSLHCIHSFHILASHCQYFIL